MNIIMLRRRTHSLVRRIGFLAVFIPVMLTPAALGRPAGAASIDPRAIITFQGNDVVELFVNGQYLGRTSASAPLAIPGRPMIVGDNVIVFRARKGTAASPALFAQIAGQFGKAGTGREWRVKAATATEATEIAGAWTQASYDDSSWARALASQTPLPGGFPTDGPAKAIWSADTSTGVMLFRLKLYVPDINASAPMGYGRGVTGGQGGATVRVTTRAQLEQALCATKSGNQCTDVTPRIIEVAATINFTGAEGTASANGCYTATCTAPAKSERLALTNSSYTHCNGKSQFPVSYDRAGFNPLLIGSNKTVIGVGNLGRIMGKGLAVRGGAANVIIRNLSITDVNQGIVFAGDAITLDNADRVWIDHNYIARIGRQMFVTGNGKASNVTFSWNELDGNNSYSPYCNGHHYWNILLYGANDTITLANNYIHTFSGRGPHVGASDRSETVHVANNYYYDGSWHAVDVAFPERALVEGNYFERVSVPVLRNGSGDGYVYAPQGTLSSTEDSACRSALGRVCAPNVASPTPPGNGFVLNAPVLDTFRSAPAGTALAPYPADKVPQSVPSLAGAGHI